MSQERESLEKSCLGEGAEDGRKPDGKADDGSKETRFSKSGRRLTRLELGKDQEKGEEGQERPAKGKNMKGKKMKRKKAPSISLCQGSAYWMSHLPACLCSIPLSNLALPGSHDAMTYSLDESSEVSGNGSKLLQFMDKHMHCIIHPIILRWSITQVLTVSQQLDAGIRYFDLRVAHKPDDHSMNLYFVHMLYTTVIVQDALWEILGWLEAHPWEVVVLAFRNFDGLDEKHHCHLVSCIKRIFCCKLCPRKMVPTLHNLWSCGYQVIVSYDESTQLLQHSDLWPAIPYWWGNKTKAQELIHYLEKRKQGGRPAGLFVAGTNLTADLGYILAHLRGSLKKMTFRALPFLNLWIKKQHPGLQKDCMNIIAGDFIERNNFVENVIELNRKLLSKQNCCSVSESTSLT